MRVKTSTAAQITQALHELAPDEPEGWDKVLPLVYDELYRRSQRSLRGERRDHTLQPTALVNEVFVLMAGDGRTPWRDRGHFFRVASRIMRHVLINHARDRGAQKRGGGRQHVALDDMASQVAVHDTGVDLLALDEALTALAAVDEQKARVVELRFFGECTVDETAEALGISTATVERGWRFARAWLRSRLDP
jgi:RNA polymerase sigma factor (TIGR02999 family)